MKIESDPPQSKHEITRKRILLAILRIEKGRPQIVKIGRKLSIASVAEESGISPASIHNNYPDEANLIRKKMGTEIRKQKNAISAKIQQLKSRIRGLAAELSELKEEFASLASINASLMQENSRLTSILKSDNIKILTSKSPE